jgi:hypothetical protein
MESESLSKDGKSPKITEVEGSLFDALGGSVLIRTFHQLSSI